MQKLVFTNGGGQTIDLTSGNFGITNWEGLSGVGLNIQTQQVPFQDGGVFLDALMEQREISVTVAIQDNNDLSARYELKRQLISALNPKLGEGVLVYTNDYLARQIKAVPQLPIFENKNSNDAGTLKASVTFSCPSPYWEDLEDTVVEIDNSNMGTIENKGDIDTQLKANISIENGKISLQNLTTGKGIETTENLTGNIEINTNIGQKSVNLESDTYQTICGSVYNGGILIGDKVIICGYDIIVFDILSNEKKNIQSNLPTTGLDIAYSPTLGLYALVGEDSKVYTSRNLSEWTPMTTGAGNIISWEDSMFKAKVNNNTFLKSTDGVTWTSQSGTVKKSKTTIKYKGNYYRTNGRDIQKSSDNTNWTTVYVANNQILFNFILDVYGTLYFFGISDTIVKTTDGGSFQIVSGNIAFANLGKAIQGFGNLYILQLQANSEKLLYYKNNEIKEKQFSNEILDIMFNDDKLYVLVYGNNYSVDIYEFTDEETYTIYNVAWVTINETANFFVDNSTGEIYCNTGSNLLQRGINGWTKNDDFANWKEQASIGAVGNMQSFNGDVYIAIKGADYKIYRTSDFQNYSLVYTSTNNNDSFFCGFCDDSNIIFSGYAGLCVSSADGQNWANSTVGDGTKTILGINKIKDTYYFFGEQNINFYTSLDLSTFTTETSPQKNIDGLNWVCIFQNHYYYFGNASERGFMGGFIQKSEQNVIDKISYESDVGLNIKKGINSFVVTGSEYTKAIITYRQKYIGV